MLQLRLIVRGRVQGVGFRVFVHRAGTRLGLEGEVRNLEDGSVEVRARGRREALESLRDEVREGPPGARVLEVQEIWEDAAGGPGGFRING